MKHLCLCSLLIFAFMVGCDSLKKDVAVKTPDAASSSNADATVEDGSADVHFLIDVRSQAEWDEGHLDTAEHIPHTEIVEGIKKVTDDKNAKIYLH